MPVTAFISTTPTGTEIEAPFNRRFIAQLKQDIPAAARQWKPDVPCTDPENHHACSGRWVIHSDFTAVVVAVAKIFYNRVEQAQPDSNTNFEQVEPQQER